MRYEQFKDNLTRHFDHMIQSHDRIFEVDCDRDELYARYLAAFPEGTNPIFRERTEHDCSACRRFIRDIGGAVFIDDDLSVHTMWEFEKDDPLYGTVAMALDSYLYNRNGANPYKKRT